MKKMLHRIWGILLAVTLILSGPGTVSAFAEGEEAESTVAAAETSDPNWPSDVEVTSESAIIMEANTGAILYEKNADEQHYPASITKILTTLLAIENCSLDETVTFSENAVTLNEGDTSNISRDIGEEMTLEQCLYAIMLESANECAYAVAEHVCDGDYEAFIDMMNAKATELGCTNTHFENANGLPNENHLTTCHDMALIARAAISNPTFRTITGTKSYQIPPTNKHSEITPLNNHHCMLHNYQTSEYLYDYCIGGKTGYTEDAGNTLVTFAEKDGMTLICVVMKTDSEAQYLDTTRLFNYCFANYKMCTVGDNETRLDSGSNSGGGLFDQSAAFAKLDSDAKIILPIEAEFNDTTYTVTYNDEPGNVVGSINYFYGDHAVGSADVLTTGATVVPYEFGSKGEAEEETDEDGVNVSQISESWDSDDSGFSLKNLFNEGSLFTTELGPFTFLEWLALAVLAIIVILIVLLIRLIVRGGRRHRGKPGTYDRRYTVIPDEPKRKNKKKRR